MARFLAILLLLTALALPPRAEPVLADAGLDSKIAAIVGSERDQWGILAVGIEDGQTVYSHNPSGLLLPASNEKALTTAAILDALGPSWTTRTSVYGAARPGSDGVLKGDLVLYGRGDPNLSGRFASNHDPLAPFASLASTVRAAGVTRVEGGLVADESFLSGAPHGSGWAFEDIQWHFGAEVSALSFNDNLAEIQVRPGAKAGDKCEVKITPDVGYLVVVSDATTIAGGEPKIKVHRDIDGNRIDVSGTLRAGSAGWTGEVAVARPALYAAAAFRRALSNAGVEVSGPTRRMTAYDERPKELAIDGLVELAGLDSQPLSEMIKVVNKHSQNLHAELLLRLLGHERGAKDKPSDEAGVAMVTAFVEKVGAAAPGMVIRDGCGLSRMDRTAPSVLQKVMAAMGKHPSASVYAASLPEAGVDGTLRGRLRGVALKAKTGSLDVAKSLSGFLTTKGGKRLAIAVIYNNWSGTGDGIGKIDRIVATLAAQ